MAKGRIETAPVIDEHTEYYWAIQCGDGVEISCGPDNHCNSQLKAREAAVQWAKDHNIELEDA